MNLPNLPTDNLYKFLMISGLVFFVFSSYQMNVYSDKFYRESEPLAQQLDQAVVQQARLEEELKFLEKDVKIYSEAIDKGTLSTEEVTNQGDALNKRLSEIEAKRSEINTRIQPLARYSDHAIKELTILTNYVNVGMITGGFFILYGYWMWYYKLQKYQDEIIKNEAIRSREKRGN